MRVSSFPRILKNTFLVIRLFLHPLTHFIHSLKWLGVVFLLLLTFSLSCVCDEQAWPFSKTLAFRNLGKCS